MVETAPKPIGDWLGERKKLKGRSNVQKGWIETEAWFKMPKTERKKIGGGAKEEIRRLEGKKRRV